MSGHGTGSPLHFGCSKCRQGWNRLYHEGVFKYPGTASRVQLTGRMRQKNLGSPGRYIYARNGAIAREYKCLDCGHVGWSTHSDLGSKR